MLRRRGVIFLLGLCTAIIIGVPVLARAESSIGQTTRFLPEITIPGLLDSEWVIDGTSIAQYIRVIFIFFVWAVGAIAIVMVIYGGIRWVAAAGNPGRINDARDIINSAVIGVIIALSSIVLLNIINPRLSSFKGLSITTVNRNEVNFDEDPGAPPTNEQPPSNMSYTPADTSSDRTCKTKGGNTVTIESKCAFDKPLFVWPVGSGVQKRVNSRVGKRYVADNPNASTCHPGTDFTTNAETGKDLIATHTGTITELTAHNGKCDEYAFKIQADGYFTRYVHVKSVAAGIENGVTVKQGQIIGKSGGAPGDSKCSAVPHLHVEFGVAGQLRDIDPCLIDKHVYKPSA